MRALKILVSVMGVLIIVATAVLVVMVVKRMGQAGYQLHTARTADPSTDIALKQPAGTHISGMAEVDGRLAVWLERPDGARIILVDPNGARAPAEIRLGE